MRSLLGVAVVLLLASSPSFAFVPPAYDDAPIRAIRFVDKDQGVAVGDQGVVWMTLNGGKTWDRMKSGTKASLRAVCFAGPFHGWAVGRTELGVGSAGVVLATADGGLTWAEVNATSLPGLNVVQFFDETHGIAAGDGTPGNPGGVFVTQDGGKNWVALSGPPTTSWTCGQFENMSTGTLGGVWGKLTACEKGIQKPAVADVLAGRTVRGLAFDGPNGVAACDTGMILTTADGGKSWAACDTGLPAAVSASVDFRCVARSGNTVWMGGKPGSVVLKSTDGGKTWATCRTGWNLPLNAMCATSATDVWAAGECGTILKSADGGKTWTVQKCGGQRAAVLFTNASGADVPMDAVAMLGGKDGYLSAAVAVTGADAAADPKHFQDEFRLQSAMRLAGGTAADCLRTFPLPIHLGDCKPADLFALWGAPTDDRLVRELVLVIRMWGPDVIVSDVLSNAASPAEQVVLAAVQKAFKLAEDPKAFPEQIEALGLKPVAVKKLYAVAPEPSKDAPVKHDNTLFAKTLFNTPQGYAEPACAALGEGITPPSRRSFRLVSHRVPGCEGHAEMTVGLDLAEGGTARRKLPSYDPSVDPLFKEAEGYFNQRRTIEGLVLSGNTTVGVERAMAMAAGSLRKLPDDVACRTAVSLGRQMAAQGRWVAARELFLIAADRYADFPEAAEAVRWLGRYYASSEARTRAAKENAVVLQYSLIAPKDGAVKQAAHVEAVTANNQPSMRLTDGEATQAWCRACLEMDGKRKGFGPAYTHDPAMAVLTASARRQLGLTQDAVKGVSGYFAANPGLTTMTPGANLWRDCLAAELWLADRTAVPVQPKPFALCPKVANKPFLDGKLDDDCWKGQKPIEARTARGDLSGYATKAYFAFDDEYLYFAVECAHPEGKGLPKAEQRRRDDDLRGKDRVDILLDLDRDYQTYYRLQVDQRGCVAEDCWGDATWNPKWFVAVEPAPTGWTAEIAVPRAELAGGAFKPGTTWGMNVTRVVPGLGCQSWSGPAADTPRPEGMGLMQLHDEKK